MSFTKQMFARALQASIKAVDVAIDTRACIRSSSDLFGLRRTGQLARLRAIKHMLTTLLESATKHGLAA